MQTIYLTTCQAATELEVSDAYARRLCRQGRLGRRIGRNWAVTAADLRKYLASLQAKRASVSGP